VTQRISARVFRGTARNIAFLAARLRAGELVAVPSETVYGLAANALDARACARIFRAKGRPTTDPLIIHLHDPAALDSVAESNDAARRLAAAFWPGPLTLVLPKRPIVPGIVTAGRDSVAVRVPSHPLLRRLLAAAQLPLAAPSANRFGYISPTTAAHVRDGLGDRIRFILDGGACPIGVESTIVDLRVPKQPQILRPGFITARQIAAVLRRPVKAAAPQLETGSQVAPGMLARHYSPRTPVVVHARLLERDLRSDPAAAWVLMRKPTTSRNRARHVYWLDATGDLEGAARELFATLRRLDRMKFRTIHVELARGSGLAVAINDRLQRAAAR
jgi:L-threonylcarbamoyladenylate synthase